MALSFRNIDKALTNDIMSLKTFIRHYREDQQERMNSILDYVDRPDNL